MLNLHDVVDGLGIAVVVLSLLGSILACTAAALWLVHRVLADVGLAVAFARFRVWREGKSPSPEREALEEVARRAKVLLDDFRIDHPSHVAVEFLESMIEQARRGLGRG